MNNRDIERIQLINKYCKEILSYTDNMSFEEFSNDLMFNRGIVLTIEQIGENANKLTPEFKELHNDLPWQAMASMRNRIAHGYSGVNLDIVWLTVTVDIPKLLNYTEEIIKNTH